MKDFYSETIAVTVDTSRGKVTIATSYLPPARPYLPLHDFMRLASLPHPCYLIGDLNAKDRLLGTNGGSNPVGRQLAEEIRRGDWTHLGPRFQTCHSHNGSGKPDIVLANRHAHFNTHIAPGPGTGSDHTPILFTISTNPIVAPTTPRWDYKNANWDAFKDHITGNLPAPQLDGRPVAEIDAAVETFYRVVEEAKEIAIPKKNTRIIPHPVRSQEIRRLEEELSELREEGERTYWDRHKYATMKRLQRDLIREGKRLQSEKWGDLIRETANNRRDTKKFWAAMNRFRGSQPSHSDMLVDRTGPRPVRIFDKAGKERFMRQTWEKVFRISPQENRDFDADFEARVEGNLAARAAEIEPFPLVDLARLDAADPSISPITADDVKRVIGSFKNGKAPGKSGVRKPDLAALPANGMDYLAQVFSASLSSGYFPHRFKHATMVFIPKSGKTHTNPLNYRPISLLETPGKVYEKLLNERIRDYAEDNNLQDPQQYGFRPGRGTGKAIALAYETVAQAVAENGSANLILRDVEKAFDKVYHAGLVHRLLELGIPNLLIRSSAHFLSGRTASIRMEGLIGPAFPLLSGVPQGSCLSPTLFILYTSDTPPPDPRTHSTHYAFADDHLQIVTQAFRFPQAMARNTGRAAEVRNRYERQRKIRNHLDKLRIVTPRRRVPAPLVIDGRRIRYSQECCHLGLRMTLQGIKSQIVHLKAKADRNLNKLRRFRDLPADTKVYLYKVLIRPILEYPAVALVTASRSAQYELQIVQNKALMWAHGYGPDFARPTNQALHEHFGVEPLNVRLHELARRTWTRLDEDQDPNFMQLVQDFAHVDDQVEHSWWRRSRPRAIGPPPAPMISHRDIRG